MKFTFVLKRFKTKLLSASIAENGLEKEEPTSNKDNYNGESLTPPEPSLQQSTVAKPSTEKILGVGNDKVQLMKKLPTLP